jgi:hypothetical protein
MANGKYAKYVNEFIRPSFIKDPAMLDKMTIPPLWFDKAVLKEAVMHTEIFMMLAKGAGFGTGQPLDITFPTGKRLLKTA